MSYRLKVILAIALVEIMVLVSLVAASIHYLETSNQKAFIQYVESETSGLALLAKDAVLASDVANLESFARQYMDRSNTLYVRISDNTRVLVEYGAAPDQLTSSVADKHFDAENDGVFDITKIIYSDSIPIGKIDAGLSTEDVSGLVSDTLQKLIAIAIIEVLVVGFLSWTLGNFLIRDLNRMREQLEQMSDGTAGRRLRFEGSSEFKPVADAFNRMAITSEEHEKDRNDALDSATKAVVALREREESLALLLDTITDGVIVINRSLLIIDMNEAAERTLEATPGLYSGASVSTFIVDKSDIEQISAFLESADNNDGPGRRSNLGKRRIIGEGGRIIWVDLTASIIFSAAGERCVLAFRDLTFELSSHSEIQRRDLLNKAISVASMDGILVLDERQRVVDVNPSASAMLGRARHQLIDHSAVSVLGLLGREETLMTDMTSNSVIEDVSRHPTQLLELTSAEGEVFPTSYRISQFVWADKRYTTMLIKDLREQSLTEKSLLLAKEAAEKANQAKSDFLSHVTHEIRSPLNATVGCINLLAETTLDRQQRLFADSARQSTSALLSLVNNILDFARIESGTLELGKDRFSVRDVLESVLDIKSFQIDQRRVSMSLVIDPAVDIDCYGDAVRLRQVLLNLVDNALKFTSDGGVVIRAGVDKVGRLDLSVQDTGIGIPLNKQQAIFDAFTQVDSSDATLHGGSGLGLAICRELVDYMGGELTISSEIGEGSRFSFQIPMECHDAEILPCYPQQHVWLVSPNSIHRAALEDQCKLLGMSVESAGAIETLLTQSQKPDRIFIDELVKPDAQLLARRRAEGCVVILMADHMDLSGYQQCEAQGFDNIIAKPLRYSQLVDSLTTTDHSMPNHRPVSHVAVGQAAAKEPGNEDIRLLLAEDSSANQLVARTMLEQAGYTVFVANDGQEVLDALEVGRFDLILMDLRMPTMDGLEATRRIRQSGGAYSGLPIIALTANATKDDAARCIAVGMNAFVGKPFRFDELLSAIDDQLAGVQEGRTLASAGLVIMDESILKRLATETSEAVLHRMVQVFIAEIQQRHRNLLVALDVDDCHRVEDEAHTLKSNAATFGASALANLAKEVEQACKRMDRVQVSKLIPEINDVVAQTLELYVQHFGPFHE